MVRATFKTQNSVSSFRRQREYACFDYLLTLIGIRSHGDQESRRADIELPKGSSFRFTDEFDLSRQEVSKIYVVNEGHNVPLGVTLTSDPLIQEHQLMKCRHTLTLNDDSCIAETIKIKNNDEIILLHGKFLPCKTHSEVLEMFKEMKVDGEALNKLMVRRNTRLRKLKWYELLTILAPVPDATKGVQVTMQEKHKLKKRDIKMEFQESVHIYKIPGTQRYMAIDDTGLRTNLIIADNRNDSTLLIKTTMMCVDKRSDFLFYASLRDKLRSRYISVQGNDRSLILADTPHWFEFCQIGNRTRFVDESTKLHLAYNDETQDVMTSDTEFLFEEYSPLKSGAEVIDN